MTKKLTLFLILALVNNYGFGKDNAPPMDLFEGSYKELLIGIIGTAICGAFAIAYKKWFIPYLNNWRYDGINLTSTWIEKYEAIFDDEKEQPNKQEQSITLKITHKGKSIKGIAELRDTEHSRHRVGPRDFEIVKGYIKDGYVRLILEIISKNKIGTISYILKIEDEGDTLEGLSIYYNSSNRRISPSKSVLIRE